MFHKGKYDREKQLRFSIRKVSFGAASVAVAALFMFLGNGAVAAAEPSVTPNTGEKEILNLSSEETKDNSYQNGANAKDIVTTNNEGAVGNSTTESKPTEVETLNKKSLIDLIAEIEGKFAKDTYANKTEDSVNQLKTVLNEAKSVLNNAKTQAELSQAHAKLVTATTKLQTKPEDKKEAPAVETTNGKVTVGIKATNTEKANESNSIANSGSRDQRNGKALDANNPFRIGSTTTDTDASANQTYTAPAADANLETLSNELKNLPNMIENNKKVQDMDTLGNALNVEKGSVTEINEFGGWKAVGDTGKFAIARKTEAGVFPIETVNTVWAEGSKSYVTWVLEQSFNRDSDYMLFLSKVRTKASSTEEAYDNSTYVSTGLGKKIAKGVKGFDGIQKTFKAYSKEHGSKVIVSFKTGYTGDIDGTKAQYKVEVIINRNGQEEKLYNQTFTPEVSKTNTEMTVVKASDGKNSPQNFSTPGTPVPTKAELEAKMANNKPNGTGGTFKSKEIELPEGVTEYTVRISSADNLHLGMGYQSPYRHYALPVTGLDFNVDQDTGAIAKDLLSRIYDKLKATESADTDGKTNETKAAYLAELENIKTLVTSTDVKKTVEYKEALEAILSKQLALKVDKTGLTDSKALLDGLVNEDPTPGKTQDTAAAYNATKQEAIKAIEAAKTVIDNENATVAQVREALAAVNTKKTALQQAKDGLIEAATVEEKAKLKSDADLLTKADETGKTPDSIAVYERKYEELKDQLEVAKAEADKVLAKGNNATKEEVKAAQAKVDAVKTELETAKNILVEAATTEEKTKLKTDSDALKKADTTGKTADSIKAYGAEFEKLKAQLEETKAEADKVLAKGNNATKEEVKAAQEKVDAVKTELETAKNLLVEAATTEEKTKLKTDSDALKKADTTGKTADSIKAYGAEFEKLKAQLEETKAEADKVLAKGNNATKEEVKAAQEKVDAVKTALDKAAESLKDLDRDAAKKEIADAAKKATDAIEASTSLTPEQKADEKAKVAKEAKDATDAIDNATTEEGINSAKENGKLAIEKEAAISAIKATKEAKLSEIDKNTSLSDDEKAASKAEVAKVAIEAVEAIQKAETQEAVNTAQSKGETAIKAVNPVGKEKALDAIQKATEEKIAEIDKNAKLSAEEKAASKAEVAKAAIEAVEAIQKAETQEAVNAAQAKGEAAIKAVNPVGKEKALEAIQKVAEEKIAEIDKNDKLSAEEKAAAKAEVAKAATEAVEAIKKADTQAAVEAAQSKGETAIKAVNPVGKATAKAAIDKALAEKEKAIDARTDLTDAEKEVAKKSARAEAESAKKAIDNATDSEAVEKALRTFLYQIDQESLVYNRPTFNLEAYIQASITGVVKVERGKAITQADIISKLSLPENVTVISIDLPDTNTLGDKFAKVMLRLPDGTEVTVKVPVRVVASQNGDSKPETALPDYGRNNGATNTETKVDKAKLEGAIRQLDELIIQESTRLDAATALLAEAKAVFANAKASQAEVDAMVKRIEDFMAKVASSTNHATSANDQADQTPAVAPATTQVANASQTASAQANARTATKELPNTGTADSTVAMVAAVASALLGLGLAGRRRKEDEEA